MLKNHRSDIIPLNQSVRSTLHLITSEFEWKNMHDNEASKKNNLFTLFK